MKPGRSRLRRIIPAVAIVLAVTLSLALPGFAAAHATLEGSTPARGAALESAPAEVVLEFSEPVETGFGAVRVFDSSGSEVQRGEQVPSENGSRLSVALDPGLGDGFYTATYRVLSADSHPVSGGFVFTVGDPGIAPASTVSELLAASETGPVTEAAFWLDRWIGYMAIAAAVGLIGFLLLVWAPLLRRPGSGITAGRDAAARRFFRVLCVATVAGFAASLLALALQGATAAGTSFWSALDPEVINEVLGTRYGEVMALRALAWLAFIPLLLAVPRALGRERPLASAPVALAAAASLVLVVTPALAGHASTQDPAWLILPSAVLHVAAMALWTGGLLALIIVLPAATRRLASDGDRSRVLSDSLLRFSTVALWCVGVIAVSGTVQAVVAVGSFGDMVEAPFGRAVIAKVVLFAVLIGVAAAVRRRVIPKLVALSGSGAAPGATGVRLRRNLRVETALAALVLAVTAALVSYPPPVAAEGEPVSGTVVVAAERLDYTVDPARTGSNEVHIYLSDGETGAPLEVDGLELSFSLPEKEIAPIEEEVSRAGPGHFLVPSAMLSVEGEWQAEAIIRLSRFDQLEAEFEVEIK